VWYGGEVGLASPNSEKLVALGTIQKKKLIGKAKANVGQLMADTLRYL
jgi:hypothetical protein